MLTRRLILTSTLALSTLGVKGAFASEALPKKKPFVLGKDYILVKPPLKLAKAPIVIHDFFSYTCPHCYKFAPLMAEFKKKVESSKKVVVVPVPVAWDAESAVFAKAYFAFEALGRLNELHMAYWKWFIYEDHEWNTVPEAVKDTQKWVQEHGIRLATWNKTLKSFAVQSKTENATKLWKNYGIDSTPMVGVAGTYLTAPHMVGNRPQTIELVFELLDKLGYRGN